MCERVGGKHVCSRKGKHTHHNLFCRLEVLEFIQFAQGSPQNV